MNDAEKVAADLFVSLEVAYDFIEAQQKLIANQKELIRNLEKLNVYRKAAFERLKQTNEQLIRVGDKMVALLGPARRPKK